VVAGTTVEGASLGSVRLFCVGSASHSGGGHDWLGHCSGLFSLVRRGLSQPLCWRTRQVRALLWPLLAWWAWPQPATVVAGTTDEGAALASVRTPRRTSQQSPEQRPHHSFPPLICLSKPTPTKRSEARSALLFVVHATQWLAEPTKTYRTGARAAPSPSVPATTVSGCSHADQANRGLSIALNFRARHHSGCLTPRRTSEQRPEQRLNFHARQHSGCLIPR
jgi:hypothetical protein